MSFPALAKQLFRRLTAVRVMDGSAANLINLTKLLPKFEDISKLVENEIDASYILMRATCCMQALHVTGQLDNGVKDVALLLRALVDRYWERIHSGHFSTVALETRKIYAIGCYFKGNNNELLERCSYILDQAQLLGCTKDLYAECEQLQAALMQYLDAELKPFAAELPMLAVVSRLNCRCDIPQLNAPSISEFEALCFKPLQPTLLLNIINHWPAMSKWRDLNYLLKTAGNRSVPIEIGSSYANDEWAQQLIKFRDFLHRQFGQTSSKQQIEYLAQHELFTQIPALKADICVPDYCAVGEEPTAWVDIKAWLGPKGTVSPLHQDPKHNLLCQVFGRKKIILAAPADTPNLYAHESEFLNNTSQIDACNIDVESYPLAAKVRFLELSLQPGDCLYMPPKWWHYVRAETQSFSVSFWWQ